MKRLRILALFAAVLLAACSTPSNVPSPEPTQEIVAEVTPEITAGNPSWVSITRPDQTYPGWEFQHPEGWELVTLDGRNVFLYSTPTAGERLLISGLQPGEVVFQISMNASGNPDETPESHLSVLTRTLRDMTLGAFEPVTVAGMPGMRQIGTSEALGITVMAISREFQPSQFIDVFAYSRTDEFDSQLPLLSTVIETVRYVLPTE